METGLSKMYLAYLSLLMVHCFYRCSCRAWEMTKLQTDNVSRRQIGNQRFAIVPCVAVLDNSSLVMPTTGLLLGSRLATYPRCRY